jgi:4-amino-4-deoxychorismate lyase
MILDEGYMFGLGAFETIDVRNGKAVLLPYHLERLEKARTFFQIQQPVTEEIIVNHLTEQNFKNGVLKVMLSAENLTMTTRANPYTPERYEAGFCVTRSSVLRNESSPLTYMKTFNYGDNILEKRKAAQQGFDEIVFLNTKGEFTEGACTNLFFVKNRTLYTPSAHCGLLAGTVRRYLMEHYPVIETEILPNEIDSYDEIFLTNALMGIMPVRQFENQTYTKHPVAYQLLEEYRQNCY